MAKTYYITTIQLNKLRNSPQFQRRKISMQTTELDKPEWQKIFSSDETLAWNSHYVLEVGDQFLFTGYIAEVVRSGG